MNAFRKMCVTICGRFGPDEGRRSAIYGNRIRAKYTAKWDAQIVRMIFQTRYKLQIFLPTVRYFPYFSIQLSPESEGLRLLCFFLLKSGVFYNL